METLEKLVNQHGITIHSIESVESNPEQEYTGNTYHLRITLAKANRRFTVTMSYPGFAKEQGRLPLAFNVIDDLFSEIAVVHGISDDRYELFEHEMGNTDIDEKYYFHCFELWHSYDWLMQQFLADDLLYTALLNLEFDLALQIGGDGLASNEIDYWYPCDKESTVIAHRALTAYAPDVMVDNIGYYIYGDKLCCDPVNGESAEGEFILRSVDFGTLHCVVNSDDMVAAQHLRMSTL